MRWKTMKQGDWYRPIGTVGGRDEGSVYKKTNDTSKI